MRITRVGAVLYVALSASAGIAQTNVTTTSGGTSGSIPVFTSNANIESSVISQSNGNVGIGTTNSTEKLDVNGAIKVIPAFPQGSGNGAYVYSDGTQAFFDSYGPNTTTYGNVWLCAHKSDGTGGYCEANFSTTQITFNTPLNVTGNVGIGTTSPSQRLEVNGGTQVDGALNVTGTLTVSGTGGLNVQNGGMLFPDGTLQTTAYPASSSGGSAPIQVVNNPTENENEAEINGGVSANGSGLKHISSNASCQIYQYNWNMCSVTITWPGTPFADTNYDVVCTPKTGAYGSSSNTPQGIILYVPDSGKTTTTATVTVQAASTGNEGGLATLAPGFSCIAIHD